MKRVQILFFALSAVSLGGFLLLYLYRAELYALTEVSPASISDLYPAARDSAAIVDFEKDRKSHVRLRLRNLEDCRTWQLLVDGEPRDRIEGTHPEIKLSSGIHDYELRPLDCRIESPRIDAIRLNLFFGASESFGRQNLDRDQIQVNRANLPVRPRGDTALSRWVPSLDQYPPAEVAEARKLLLEAGFDQAAPTREKIEFIANFVLRRMPPGTPAVYLNTISPLSVFKEVNAQRSGAFCRQWSLTYGFLANVVGIPTRNLFTGGFMRDVDMGSHAFSESYIAAEARWAYVDPTNGIALVTNPDGEVLNGAAIYMALVNGMEEGLIASAIDGASVTSAPFSSLSAPVRYFMHRENFLIYIGAHDGRYQLGLTGPERYLAQLYRFIFEPQQYFGYTHFTSFYWLRGLTFFFGLISGLGGLAIYLFRLARAGRRARTT